MVIFIFFFIMCFEHMEREFHKKLKFLPTTAEKMEMVTGMKFDLVGVSGFAARSICRAGGPSRAGGTKLTEISILLDTKDAILKIAFGTDVSELLISNLRHLTGQGVIFFESFVHSFFLFKTVKDFFCTTDLTGMDLSKEASRDDLTRMFKEHIQKDQPAEAGRWVIRLSTIDTIPDEGARKVAVKAKAKYFLHLGKLRT